MKYKMVDMVLILICLYVLPLSAQIDFSIATSQSYESNPLRLQKEQSSWVSSYDVGIQYSIDFFNIGYNGSYNMFTDFSERNFYWQQAAIFIDDEDYEWGGYLENQLYNPEFEIYEMQKGAIYFNRMFNLDIFTIFWNSELTLNEYIQLSEIDNYGFYSSLKVNKSFESKTTLIGSIGYKFKKYMNDQLVINASENVQYSILGNGRGPGKGGKQPAYGDSVMVRFTDVEAPSVSQLYYSVRLAQSLFSKTGVAIDYSGSTIVEGINRDITGLTYNYMDESQIFDDPFGYNRNTVGIELTQILPDLFILKSAYYYSLKYYNSQGIYRDAVTYDSDFLRKDKRNIFWIDLTKRFYISMLSGMQLVTSLNYQYLRNTSNSFFYNYTNNYINLNFSLQF